MYHREPLPLVAMVSLSPTAVFNRIVTPWVVVQLVPEDVLVLSDSLASLFNLARRSAVSCPARTAGSLCSIRQCPIRPTSKTGGERIATSCHHRFREPGRVTH